MTRPLADIPAGPLPRVEIVSRPITSLDEIDTAGAGDLDFVLEAEQAVAAPEIRIRNALERAARRWPWLLDPPQWRRRPFVRPGRRIVRLDGAIHAGQGVLLTAAQGAFDLSCPRNGKPNDTGALTGRADGLEAVREIAIEGAHAGSFVHLGDLPDHFGHFLLEAPARLWALAWGERRELRPVAFRSRPLLDWQKELLRAAGADPGAILIAPGPARFERLFAPNLDFALHRGARPELRPLHERIAEALAPQAGPPSRRVFLARGAWASRRQLVNEAEIAALFAAHGFETVHPETLPLADQVRLARESAVLAGPIGSQMHLAMFQQAGCGVILLAPDGFAMPDDAILAGLRGARANYLCCRPVDAADQSPPIARPFRAGPDEVEAALARWL